MGSENTDPKVIQSQVHRNVRLFRATILRGKTMKQMNPARLNLGHAHTAAVERGNHEYNDSISLMQKQVRYKTMSVLCEKKDGFEYLCKHQFDYQLFVDRTVSDTGRGGGGAIRVKEEQFDESDSHTGSSGGGGEGKGKAIISYEAEEKHNSDEDLKEDTKGSAIKVEADTAIQDEHMSLEHTKEATEGSATEVEEHTAVQDGSEVEDENEELDNIWKEMDLAIDSCKEFPENQFSNEIVEEDIGDCDHAFILKDDIGFVCRVCGLVQKGIQEIFEFQYPKRARTNSYRRNEPQNIEDKNRTDTLPDWCKLLNMDEGATEFLAHAEHIKQMKHHQMQGFKFLLRNLVAEKPHGCVLAHAPGSGKTFMIICFMQSYLAKYPSARPLVILPKGILGTWKNEFRRWQLDEIPLLDFYSAKSSSRTQQLNVLKQWAEQKSILFLGYKQFSSIVIGDVTSKEQKACREILVRAPTVLILDEGHTPRNKNTDILHSLTLVQTPRKVVLSGTLYQNHVEEVFNILNLVQPKFLKLDHNREIVSRIMSKVEISGVRKQLTGDAAFYELVENTLINDENKQRKVGIIKDLREMTGGVLHYYKGDSFDELPGLVDFMVLLNLSPKQKAEVDAMKRLKEGRFKCSSMGGLISVHPLLKQFSGNNKASEDESRIASNDNIDQMINKINLKDGVKAMFFLNLLRLCEIEKEKLIVFSQFLLPLKFLERLAVHDRGWSVDKHIFMITGDSTSEHRDWSMERFNNSPDSRVLFGSIKACGEGISLVGASRVLILDVHLNPSVSWQAICRAFRPGQQKKVYTYRLVAADCYEEEDHSTCLKKELISKMWFEWDDFSKKDLALESIDLDRCCDRFLQKPLLRKDIKALYKR